MLKTIGTSGQLTLGKRFSGRHFEVEERPTGELILRPVRLVRDTGPQARSRPARLAAVPITEVEQEAMPTRAPRNAHRR
jgi:hypothetical protein